LVAQLSTISDARRRKLRTALLKAARNVSTSMGQHLTLAPSRTVANLAK
jgi:hypothetical protein